MPIYRKKLDSAFVQGPPTLSDIPGLSPITIQAGSANYSFLATFSVTGLTIPTIPSGLWGITFRIMQGSNTLGVYYMGSDNGGWRPSFTFSAVGDACATGLTEDISLKWQAYNVQALLKEQASFTIIYDDRLD